jgi:hypothetical protein
VLRVNQGLSLSTPAAGLGGLKNRTSLLGLGVKPKLKSNKSLPRIVSLKAWTFTVSNTTRSTPIMPFGILEPKHAEAVPGTGEWLFSVTKMAVMSGLT